MKMNKILSLFTLATGMFAMSAAQAAGDIVDIRVMDQVGKKFGARNAMAGDERCSPDNPLIAGEYAYVRVRMLVRNSAQVRAGGKPWTWEFRNRADLSKPSPGVGPSLGLYVGEHPRNAELVIYNEDYPWQQTGELHHDDNGNESDDYTYFTDFYFKYKVQSGDMGLPVVLMGKDLKPVQPDGSGSEYAFIGLNCMGEDYVMCGVDENGVIQVAPEDVQLSLSQDAGTVDWPKNPWGETWGTGDLNLSKEGMYVKTVDFDNTYADLENGIWRDVNASGVKGSDASVVITAGSKAPEDLIVYIWSTNETTVLPTVGLNGIDVKPMKIGTTTRQVLRVQMKAGDSAARFVLKALAGAELGTKAEIFMSPNPNTTDASGTPENTAVSRTVRVVKNDPPGVSLRFDGVTPKTVTAGADYNVPVTRLVVRIENDDPARAKTVKVLLNAEVTGDSAHTTLTKIYNAKYLWLSTSESGFDPTSVKVLSVDIPAGRSSVEYFVYGLGASEKTEGNGILFTPEASKESGYEYIPNTDQPTARLFISRLGEEGIEVTSTKPSTEVGRPAEITMAKGEKKGFEVYFPDTYKNMKGEEDGDGVYSFELVGTEGDDEGRVFAKIDETSYKPTGGGCCKFNLTLESDVVQKSAGYPVALVGTSPDGSTTVPMPYLLKVIGGKQVEITLAPGYTSMTVGEGDQLEFNLGLNREADTDEKYIFLKGATDKETALFDSSLKTTGAQLGDDYQHVVGTRSARFLDGDKEVNLRAFLSDSMDDPEDVDKTWGEGKLHITVTNKVPVLRSLNIAGQPLTVASYYDKTLDNPVPLGIEKTFKLVTVDDVEADLTAVDDPATEKDDRFTVKWIIDGVEYYTYGDPRTTSVTHAFTAKTPEGNKGQLVEVYLKDKDMLGFEAEPNFRCYVKVSAKPFVSVTTSAMGVMPETDVNVAMVTVALSEPATESIDVILKIQKPATGTFKLRTSEDVVYVGEEGGYERYRLTFKSGVEKIMIVSEMDGTNDTLAGLDISAAVETEAWKTYYEPGSLVPPLRIENKPPVVLRPSDVEQAYTNEHASAGVAYPVSYGVSDVKADLEAGVDVVITVDGTALDPTAYVNKLTSTDIQKAEVTFVGEGAHVVELTFTDKDGMSSHATLNFFVQPSKRLQLRAHGPAGSTGSANGFSAKYGGAPGLGAGRVFAGRGPQTVENFVHSYSFGVAESSVAAFAYGYKADPALVDDGTLDIDKYPGRDRGINKWGNWSESLEKAGITEWYNYAADDYTATSTHKGSLGLDSFVYGWACNNGSSSKGGGSGGDSGGAAFALTIGEVGEYPIPLPDSAEGGGNNNTGNNQLKSIPIQYWEAVFSCELLKGDNCGDINADGIPDRYVLWYKFDVVDDAGALAGDDLRNLNFTAEENPQPYCVGEDYLPPLGRSAYYGLIPGLPAEWLEKGEAFTPVLKIRGFGDSYYRENGKERLSNLNDAPRQLGMTDIKPDRVYTNPKTDEKSTLSYVEWLAWSEFKAAYEAQHGADTCTVDMWSPENPTDPTKADTDMDGITDGYEYWFWYMAHVGWIENYGTKNETHRRLTGRRYDVRNPGEGVLITSEEIEIALNPNSPTASATTDTDNDGLPDILEFEIGTNPVDFDSDGDGLADGWEIMIAGLDPLLANSSADAIVDTMRNYDGDAMAISSYALEQTQTPVPVNFEHAKRWTFAVIDEEGDSDGVQWYATAEDASAYVTEDEPLTSWWKVTVGGVDYCTATEPVRTEDGRLASVTAAFTLAADGDDSFARGYPTQLPSGVVPDAVAEMTDELKVYKVADDAGAANACWIYGKGKTDARRGEVAKTAADYGCLALGRTVESVKKGQVCALPSDARDVAFLHYLCYQEFKFDPRTAWNHNSPLAKRWGETVDGQAVSDVFLLKQGGYAGVPSRTRAYAAYDEFLVCSFFENNGCDMSGYTPVVDDAAPYLAKYWGAFTTNPQGPGEPGLINEDHYYGRESENGADTDNDGVPDGWELYVMAGPKKDGAYVFGHPYAGFTSACGTMTTSLFSPFVNKAGDINTTSIVTVGGSNADDLTELREFAGTDSCNYYSTVQDGNTVAYSTTIVRPAKDANWLNKFFPTDPWDKDTDDDGISDSSEGIEGSAAYSFIYGTPADNGSLTSIPGGGLNPCSVDTDLDGLPDPWELQFKGTPESVYAGDGADYAKDADGNPIGNALQGLTDGMDGTVADAFNYPRGRNGKYTRAGGFNQVVNRDYDHDGLDNWQEYLTGTMRCWRYDDPVTPMTYIPSSVYFKEGKFDVENAVAQLMEAGLLESETPEDAVGEFWYKTLVDGSSPLYNPHFVTDTSSGAQYFSRVENVWDVAYLDATLSNSKVSGAYYWFYTRADKNFYGNTWAAAWKALGVDKVACSPTRYASCSPIDPDSDHDGMDDYYELFHGMNPLLGTSGVKGSWWSVNSSGSKNDGEGFDIVYDSYDGNADPIPQAWGTSESDPESFMNYWQRKAEADGVDFGKGSKFNFTVFPWLNGLATADADGDGTRNQEEAVMPMIAPTTAWHHTDPTALWMTDSSYSNSLVRIAYRLPVGTDKVDVGGEKTFTYKHKVEDKDVEETYNFADFDGFEGKKFIAFNPDRWSVAANADSMNWIASFEENEGYDSDHDGVNDQDELAGKFRGKTDPLDADSPRRRQAMYFQGKDRPSALQTMPFVREQHPDASLFNKYPDDLSFLQYTVECWVKPDTAEDATIIERACWTDESNPADREFLRCNFRLGIRGGKWYTKFDPNDTTKASVSADSGDVAATAGEWTHLAATYDGDTLRLYVNGVQQGFKQSGLQPAYGSSSVTVDGMAGVHTVPGMTYWRDREYDLHAIVFGASFLTCVQGVKDGSALDVTRAAGWNSYTNFYKGYIDEVRVWDGARSATEIAGAMGQRFTAADAAKNREAFYTEWAKAPAAGEYCGRYAKDGSGNPYPLPAELRFHWAFDSVFGAVDEARVAKVPSGFNYAGDAEVGGRAMLTRPAGYTIDWWSKVLGGYEGTVYDDPAWIEWIPNTVTHLPRFDGTTLDSRYWSDDFAGAKNGTYRFARTAEPVSFWTQYRRAGVGEGAIGYSSTGSRNYFVSEYDQTNRTEFAKLYEFTGRHLNQTGDDLLPLGGAFVKQCEEMWDEQGASSNWEINGGSADSADGIPAWWASYANDVYYDGDEEITWETMVKWPTLTEGMPMTAGEAYLRDLARGYVSNDAGDYAVTDGSEGDFRQRYDMDANGLPDWWEELHGIVGADIYADTDKDGLPNYVEYLLSEVFEFKGVSFSPVNPHSADPYTPDYFYRVGDVYVGELFTDHDQVDDAWEDIYPNAFASRLLYDADKDADSDGWSNRSEVRYAKQCMPTQADKQTHYSAADGLVADYPIPTLALTLNYNGANQTAVREAPIVVQVTRNPLDTAAPDATFVVGQIAETQAGTGTSSEKETDQTKVALTRTLGKWSNRHALGTLTPGYINKDSVALQFCYDPSSLVYTWEVKNEYTGISIKRGTRIEYDADRRKYGESNVDLISRDTEYKELENVELRTAENSSVATWVLAKTGLEFGTLDLTTGAFDINLGAFAGQYVVNSTNAEDYASMEDQTYRITYAVNPAVDLPRKLYLGEATTGWVREGKNQIVAFADLNSSGTFDPGEPYGVVNGVDVSWKGTSATIELTEASPVMTRISLFAAQGGASKGGSSSGGQQGGGSGVTGYPVRTVQQIYTELEEKIKALNLPPVALSNALANLNWRDTNVIVEPTIDTTEDVRVRVVRWLVDGNPVWLCGVEPRVVLDKKFHAGTQGDLTEADILSEAAFDLDWQYLQSEVVNAWGVQSMELDIAEVDYLVVIGDGVTAFMGRDDTNNVVKALSQVVCRRYGASRVKAVATSPSKLGEQIVRSANPTFAWKIAETDENGYTAFKIRVSDAKGGLVYDSGIQPAPARDVNGNYVWTAPIYAGDKGTNGVVYANNADYSWKVSMYNAKFRTDSFSSSETYKAAVPTNGFEYGTANVAVRYFGPKLSYAGKTIRVRAYTSPDFTGLPVAAGYVAEPDDAETGVSVTGRRVGANCQVIGIPAGTYYLQAFIDSNNNGVCDAWESMGYLCGRDTDTVDWLNPVAMTFGPGAGKSDLAVIYIEDADTDCDSIPDAWEFAKYGNLTEVGVEAAELTPAGEAIADLKDFNVDLKVAAGNDILGGLAGRIMTTLTSSRALAALSLGLDPEQVTVGSDGTATVKSTVKAGTLAITEFNFNRETGNVELKVTAEVQEPEKDGIESPLYKVVVADGATVTVKVWYSDTLAEKPHVIRTLENVVISSEGINGNGLITAPVEGLAEKTSGCVQVEIER